MTKKESKEEKMTENNTEEVVEVEEVVEEKVEVKIEDYVLMAQRVQAEFDNYRRRNNDAIRLARIDGSNDMITELFPILDNFERGLSAIEEESVKSGVELIYKQLVAVLTKFDVKEIEALGEEFNPTFHYAIAQSEDSENENKVVEVFQKGYIRKDKVLRPVMVKVAK